MGDIGNNALWDVHKKNQLSFTFVRKDQTCHKTTCLEWNSQNNGVLLLYYLKLCLQ